MDFLAQPVNLIITVVILSFAGTLGLYLAVLRSLHALERSLQEERQQNARRTQKLEEALVALARGQGHPVQSPIGSARPVHRHNTVKTEEYQTTIKTPAEALSAIEQAEPPAQDATISSAWKTSELPELAPLSEFAALAEKARSAGTEDTAPPVIETIDDQSAAFFPNTLDEFSSPESHFPHATPQHTDAEEVLFPPLEEIEAATLKEEFPEFMEQPSPFAAQLTQRTITAGKTELPPFMHSETQPITPQETVVDTTPDPYSPEPAPEGSKVIILEDDDSPIPSLNDLLKAKSHARNSRVTQGKIDTSTPFDYTNSAASTALTQQKPVLEKTTIKKLPPPQATITPPKTNPLPSEGQTDIFDSLPDTDPKAQPLILPNLSLPKMQVDANKKGIQRLSSLEIKIGK